MSNVVSGLFTISRECSASAAIDDARIASAAAKVAPSQQHYFAAGKDAAIDVATSILSRLGPSYTYCMQAIFGADEDSGFIPQNGLADELWHWEEIEADLDANIASLGLRYEEMRAAGSAFYADPWVMLNRRESHTVEELRALSSVAEAVSSSAARASTDAPAALRKRLLKRHPVVGPVHKWGGSLALKVAARAVTGERKTQDELIKDIHSVAKTLQGFCNKCENNQKLGLAISKVLLNCILTDASLGSDVMDEIYTHETSALNSVIFNVAVHGEPVNLKILYYSNEVDTERQQMINEGLPQQDNLVLNHDAIDRFSQRLVLLNSILKKLEGMLPTLMERGPAYAPQMYKAVIGSVSKSFNSLDYHAINGKLKVPTISRSPRYLRESLKKNINTIYNHLYKQHADTKCSHAKTVSMAPQVEVRRIGDGEPECFDLLFPAAVKEFDGKRIR